MSNSFTGSCLCGAVTYASNESPVLTGHCHCDDCRRTSGTGHASTWPCRGMQSRPRRGAQLTTSQPIPETS